MKKLIVTYITALLAAISCPSGHAATFPLDQATDVVEPSTRGQVNTTYFGWELFDNAAPIDDSTPDIGTTTTGVNFKTVNGESHRFSNGNIYFPSADLTLYEQVTVASDGVVGTGFTTVVAQVLTSSGDFAGPITLSTINGVIPTVVRTVNSVGKGQIWAKWQIPGNAASYVFTITGAPQTAHYSIDRVVVDTYWNATAYQLDVATPGTVYALNEQPALIAPSSRGGPNTTYFGWNDFTDTADVTTPIDDSTPDIGAAVGARFRTTNGEDHISSGKNFYSGFLTAAEEVTVPTSGTVGSAGYTTIIAQAVTPSGAFAAPVTFGNILGVAPTVAQATNSAGLGQIWAKWKVPGNAASYTFTITSPTGSSTSFDKFIVDTQWNATRYLVENAKETTAETFTFDQIRTLGTPTTRGLARTTYFGWDTFTDTADVTTPIDDSTPDIGSAAGVRFRTTNNEDHLSSTKNYYSGSLTAAEEVTIVTDGVEGTGFTTIIAQGITATGPYAAPITFSPIAGVNPVVVMGTNAAGLGQVWAKWRVPGNAASYTFTFSAATGASTSFDKFVVDTYWNASIYQADTARATTPPLALAMSQVAGLVTPSSRGTNYTTWFGWETFNNFGARTVPIDDSTPDIGNTTTAGARFRTTNNEVHTLASGNVYYFSGTLKEEITVPTNGVVGSNGYTTIILQLASAGGFGAFAADISLSDINGVAPIRLQSLNGAPAPSGQLYAMWKVPGNQATYTIGISGPDNQAHISLDRVIVDTVWSRNGYQGDTMVDLPPSITTASPLAFGGVGVSYSAQLAGVNGTAPYIFTRSAGTLPAGLTLSASGLLSGTPTTEATSNFTVLLTDANGLTATKAFAVTIKTAPSITNADLPDGITENLYAETAFAATGGTSPYSWLVSAGSLPAGLELSTAGILSGTPTASAVGTTTFTVQVADANGVKVTKEFSITLISLRIVTAPSLPNAVKGVDYSVTLVGSGGTSPYAWSSTDTLPAGLSLTSAGVISGKPTATALTTTTFAVKLTDSAETPFSVTKSFSITVYPSYQKPVLNPISLGTTTIGSAYDYTVSATNYPKTFSIVGLPAGLKYVAATGVISGRPSVSGVFNVQIKATNTGGASVAITTPLVVKALDRGFIGTFTGIVSRDSAVNGNLGSRLALTTTTNGSYSIKITTGATTVSAIGFLAASAPQIDTTVAGKTLELNFADNLVSGSYRGAVVTGGAEEEPIGATVSGWRSTWNVASNPASGYVGYYSFGINLADVGEDGDDGVESIPQGSGYATFSVVDAGTLSVVGKTADGQAITSAGFIGPDGEIAVYTGLYTNKGSIVGELKLAEDEEGLFYENIVSGPLTWSKPRTTAKAYEIGFDAINLAAYGKYLAESSKSIVLGLPETGNANFVFSDGGLEASATEPNFSFTYSDENKVTVLANTAQASLTINRATGAVAGKFTLTEVTPPLVRKNVAFQGQVVRQANGLKKAVGYFLLQQKPVSGPISASPILSGGISIEQPVAP